jgi:hypothetical protein
LYKGASGTSKLVLYFFFTGTSLNEVEKALKMILGCAVQCDNRELYIKRIRELDTAAQSTIVEYITGKSSKMLSPRHISHDFTTLSTTFKIVESWLFD